MAATSKCMSGPTQTVIATTSYQSTKTALEAFASGTWKWSPLINHRDIAIAFAVGVIGCAAIEFAINAIVTFVTTLLVIAQP